MHQNSREKSMTVASLLKSKHFLLSLFSFSSEIEFVPLYILARLIIKLDFESMCSLKWNKYLAGSFLSE